MLALSRELQLPDDAVTQPIAILARRGAGKTYAAMKLCEELVGAGHQVVVLDPTGVWWGLRASADGKGDGLPITILGGEHGDVDIEETSGGVLAELTVDHHGQSFIIDVSGFDSDSAQDRFAADFAERLFRYKATRRWPVMLMVDEADSFAPQSPMPNQRRMQGAFTKIVKQGRSRGLGVCLITQRTATLAKSALNQSELLIIMQTTGPGDRKTIDEWVKGNGTEEERALVMGSLASLKRGEAWAWSPQWLEVLKRITIAKRRTFDSSRTPEPGEVPVEPTMAPVDLNVLRDKIAATIERAEKTDPEKLTKRIKELERELGRRPATPASPEIETVVETEYVQVEVPFVPDTLAAAVSQLAGVPGALEELARQVSETVVQATTAVSLAKLAEEKARSSTGTSDGTSSGTKTAAKAQTRRSATTAPRTPHRTPARPSTGSSPGEKMPDYQRRILIVLAQRGALPFNKIALNMTQSVSGHFKNMVGELRKKDYVEGGPQLLEITETGLKALGDFDPLPESGPELLEHWLDHKQVGELAGQILQHLVSVYPQKMHQDDIAEALGYESPASGHFKNMVGKLRGLELVNGPGSAVQANPELV